MSNPAKDITRLQTHFECLSANNAPVSAYEQGMILLSAIPDEWDHVAAYYVQTSTSVANVSFDTIWKAILAEFDPSSGNRPDQTHVIDKITAKKWKGKPLTFLNRRGLIHHQQLTTLAPLLWRRGVTERRARSPRETPTTSPTLPQQQWWLIGLLMCSSRLCKSSHNCTPALTGWSIHNDHCIVQAPGHLLWE